MQERGTVKEILGQKWKKGLKSWNCKEMFLLDHLRRDIRRKLLNLLFKVNIIPNLLIRGKPYHLRKCGE